MISVSLASILPYGHRLEKSPINSTLLMELLIKNVFPPTILAKPYVNLNPVHLLLTNHLQQAF